MPLPRPLLSIIHHSTKLAESTKKKKAIKMAKTKGVPSMHAAGVVDVSGSTQSYCPHAQIAGLLPMEPNSGKLDAPSSKVGKAKAGKGKGKAGQTGKARRGLLTGSNDEIVAGRVPRATTPMFKPVIPDCRDIDRAFFSIPSTPGASDSCGYGSTGDYTCSHWNLTAGCQHLTFVSTKTMATICSTMCSAWTQQGCAGWMIDNSRGADEYLCVLVGATSDERDTLSMQPGCFVHSGVNIASGYTAPCPSIDVTTLSGEVEAQNAAPPSTAPPPTAGHVCVDDLPKACSRWGNEGRCSVPWVQARCPATCGTCDQSELPVSAGLSTSSVRKTKAVKTKVVQTKVKPAVGANDAASVWRQNPGDKLVEPGLTDPDPDHCFRENTDSDNTQAVAHQSQVNANLTVAAGIGESSFFGVRNLTRL